MIILHENLPIEAEIVAGKLNQIYGFDSKLVCENLGDLFTHVPKLNGILSTSLILRRKLRQEFGTKKTLVLTPRDIYDSNTASGISPNDDWIFGYQFGNLFIASTARIKRNDSQPTNALEVNKKLYLDRLALIAVGEIGYGVINASHFQQTSWVNNSDKHVLELGPSCVDNACAMYNFVDIRAPPVSEGYMQLGDERRYDGGLDDLLERIHPEWLCNKCKESIHVSKDYQ